MKFKIYFLTILSVFVLTGIFDWATSSIIVFFAIFFLDTVSEHVNQNKKKTREAFLYYAGQIISIAIGCIAGFAVSYLVRLVKL